MGQITVKVALEGSFGPRREETFSAMGKGHACAVAEAIAWLATVAMPSAVALDHHCHNDGVSPEQGYAGAVVAKKAE